MSLCLGFSDISNLLIATVKQQTKVKFLTNSLITILEVVHSLRELGDLGPLKFTPPTITK